MDNNKFVCQETSIKFPLGQLILARIEDNCVIFTIANAWHNLLSS